MFAIADGEARATTYLERIERAELDESRLSNRLLDGLTAILGADLARRAPTPATPAVSMPPPAAAAAPAAVPPGRPRRGPVGAGRLPAPAPVPMDELDRLFLGGPDG